MEIVKDVFNYFSCKGKRQIGPPTWVFLVFLNMRKARRGTDRERHTHTGKS